MNGARSRFLLSRIPWAWRYLRRYGLRAILRRLFPTLSSYRPTLGIYRVWIGECDRLCRRDIAAIQHHIATMTLSPHVSVLMTAADGQESLVALSVRSLIAQLYPHWSLQIVVGSTIAQRRSPFSEQDSRISIIETGQNLSRTNAINALLAAPTGSLFTFLDPGDEMAPHGLYLVANEAIDHPDAVLIYSDEDWLDRRGRRQSPIFKSDWNPQMLLGCDSIGRLAVYRRHLIERLGDIRIDGAQDYDLALRASEDVRAEQIRHLPYVLYHRRAAGNSTDIAKAQRRVLSEHLARTGQHGITVLPGPTGVTHRLVMPLPAQTPFVSLVMPVGASPEVVKNCLSGILHNTDYAQFELLLMINNGTKRESVHEVQQMAEEDHRVNIIDTSLPFNFSRICNYGVERARGEFIGLINDDLQVIEPGWLFEMVSQVVRPKVGAVGAKLYYPDDTVQHAGVILVPGGRASHWFRRAQRSETGYSNRLIITQNLSVVTAACMVVRKSVFQEVGGFDEVNFSIAFNDVDLCLKIREKGYLIVWTPSAELYHLESASRGSDFAPERFQRFRRELDNLNKKWATSFANDPYYSPNLDFHDDSPVLAFPPRLVHPWRQRPSQAVVGEHRMVGSDNLNSS